MRDVESKTRSFYNKDAKYYDERWGTPGGEHTATVQADIVREVCYSWRGKSVLEVGCGTGRFSTLLSSIGTRLTIVDISYAMLDATRIKIRDMEVRNVEGYVNSSIYDLPFDSASFQSILSINVFSHLENSVSALNELARVLVPGGHFLVSFPNLYSYFLIPALAVNARHKSLGKEVFSVWYRPESILSMLHESGYEILSIKGHVHIPRWLDMSIARPVLRFLDRKSRSSWLNRYAPLWFVECRKSS